MLEAVGFARSSQRFNSEIFASLRSIPSDCRRDRGPNTAAGTASRAFSPHSSTIASRTRDAHVANPGGLHVSGHSEGTSLVVLPQQFSNCLRARDQRVRLVRANLMMTGLIFSGDLDTDIDFDYGIFTPNCRRADLADMKQLDLRIDLRMTRLSDDHLCPAGMKQRPR